MNLWGAWNMWKRVPDTFPKLVGNIQQNYKKNINDISFQEFRNMYKTNEAIKYICYSTWFKTAFDNIKEHVQNVVNIINGLATTDDINDVFQTYTYRRPPGMEQELNIWKQKLFSYISDNIQGISSVSTEKLPVSLPPIRTSDSTIAIAGRALLPGGGPRLRSATQGMELRPQSKEAKKPRNSSRFGKRKQIRGLKRLQKQAKKLKIRITKKVRGKRVYKTLKELTRHIKIRKASVLKKLKGKAKKRKIKVTKKVRGKRVYLSITELKRKLK
jgi:hypothetical protein